MVNMAGEPDIFTGLTWEGLEEWAGAKTVSRGRRYQQEGRVRSLARLPGGGLVAWVAGTERYATTVSTDGESIESRCTCPVEDSCKHAVAVVLEYIESVKESRPIPAAAEGDPRLRLLDVDSPPDPALRPYLERLTKDELIDLLETLARHNPPVRTAIDDRRTIATIGADPLVEALFSEIDAVAGEAPWEDTWGGDLPDYSGVKMKMETLLAKGYADEVVLAGELLLKKGPEQIEMIDEEGEIADQIAACMDIAFSALAASRRPLHEKILYAIEAGREDEYGLCTGAENLLAGEFPKEEWSIAADRLLERLRRFAPAEEDDGFTSKYHRNRLVTAIAMALDKAGRQNEATDLRMAEAGRTDAYPEVVARLLHEGRRDEALQWIYRGISETEEEAPGIAEELRITLRGIWESEAPGIAKKLRVTLCGIWESEGNWPAIAAIRAEEFFREPTYQAFRDLEEASRRAGVGDAVRDAAMRYLIAGERPPAGEGIIPGVLPDTGIKVQAPRWETPAPVAGTLIEIAIAEGKPDEVLRWHDQWKEGVSERYLRDNLEDRVADAVVDAYPERAIDIWKKKAERLIDKVHLQSYEESLRYLRRLRSHMPPPEWEEYREELRRKHVRKRRFLEVLDRVGDRRIISSIR